MYERKTLSRTAMLFISAIGLFLYRAAAWMAFDTGIVSQDSIDMDFVRGVARCAHIAAVTVALVLSRRQGTCVSRLPATGVLVAGSVAMACGAAAIAGGMAWEWTVGVIVGAAVHGAASSALFLGWGIRCCSLRPGESATVISTAFLAWGVLTLLVRHVDVTVLAIVSMLLPLVCGACLLTVDLLWDGGRSELCAGQTNRQTGSLKSMPWGVVALVACCCLVCGTVDVIAPAEKPAESPTFNILWPVLSFVVLTAVIAWTRLLKRSSTRGLWVLFAFLFFICLVGFSSFYFVNPLAASEFVRATQELLMLFIWVLATGVINECRLDPLVAFGLADLLFIQGEHVAVFAITRLSNMLDIRIDATAAIAFAFLMAVALIAMAFALLVCYAVPAGEAYGAGRRIDAPSPGDRRVELLCATYRLTEREGEVAGYLLRGYSLQKTADALNVSLDTVRYHVRNLYKKTAVHSKQDLIGLAESLGDEG